jgi:hypothetical protein
MTSHSNAAVSAPLWGFARRRHLGGPALIAFAVALWALFLGTVGAPSDRPAPPRIQVVAAGR